MPAKLIYRTYLLRLWLYSILCAPVVFFLFALLINPDCFSNTDGPLELAFHLFVALVFVLPVFLFVIITSFVVPRFVKTPQKMKTATTVISVTGVLLAFFWIYDADHYTGSQLGWGLFFTVLYAAFLALFGLCLKIEKE